MEMRSTLQAFVREFHRRPVDAAYTEPVMWSYIITMTS